MAITRGSDIPKQDATPPPPLPPTPPAETNTNNEENTQSITETAAVSDYEQTREQRIKENRERLQKLGIVDLSTQLKSMASSRRTPKSLSERRTPLKSLALGPTEPVRRSSRLQNAPPVTYVELKEEKLGRSRDIVLEEGSRPEFYTEEHDKLLGSTEMPWTFFVDGYGADGNRIYDSVKGKTCHQCRQKTLGLRTHCCKCNLVQGQFCGDCLYMRYGEHVVEANQNPDWICPPCRGICNCSLCRQAKGWAPTGSLYRRISSLGFKSVAHYLIATKRAPLPSDDASDKQQSAKRSLPFEGMEVPSDNGSDDNTKKEKTEVSLQSENKATTVTDSDPNLEDVALEKRLQKEHVDAGEESGRKIGVAEDDPVSDMKKSAGRPRKRSVKENVDGDEESARKNGTAEVQPSDMKRGVGRPRKRSTKENVDGDDESVRSVRESGMAEGEPSSDMKKGVGRPKKRSKEESVDGDQESVRKNGMTEYEPGSDMKRGVGRPRKKSTKEIVDGDEKSSRKTEDEPGSDVKRGVGRPRKKSANENVDADVESVMKSEMADDKPVADVESVTESEMADDKPVAESNHPDTSSPKMDSVARRLRPRNTA